MNRLCFFFFLLIAGSVQCQSPEGQKNPKDEGQQSQVVVEGDQIMEIAGYNVSAFDLYISELEVPYQQLSIDHVLWLMASECNTEVMIDLLEDGADPNALLYGDHILTEVAFCDEQAYDITLILIEHGADVNGADADDDPALSYAIMMDQIRMTRLLLAKGANINKRDGNHSVGCLPIHAVESVPMLSMLMEQGADVEALCTNGKTLLHTCAEKGLYDLVKYILQNGLIDPTIEDIHGKLAKDYARQSYHANVVRLFENQ